MTITSVKLDKVIDKLGSAYLINIGSYTFDIYGTGSVAYAGSYANGYVQVLNSTDAPVIYGVLNVGDAIGYFKMDANFPNGSSIEIDHQGVKFEVISYVFPPHISGNQLMKEVALRRKV